MPEYIERESLAKDGWYLQRHINGDGHACVESMNILDVPAADVQPVTRGKWDDKSVEAYRKCSECGCYVECRKPFLFGIGKCNFCPNCGADMRGEERNA